MEEEQKEKGLRIPTDGTYGTGPTAEVTIITKVGDREQKETYTFPFALISQEALMAYNNLNLILGFEIKKMGKPNPLKDLGL